MSKPGVAKPGVSKLGVVINAEFETRQRKSKLIAVAQVQRSLDIMELKCPVPGCDSVGEFFFGGEDCSSSSSVGRDVGEAQFFFLEGGGSGGGGGSNFAD